MHARERYKLTCHVMSTPDTMTLDNHVFVSCGPLYQKCGINIDTVHHIYQTCCVRVSHFVLYSCFDLTRHKLSALYELQAVVNGRHGFDQNVYKKYYLPLGCPTQTTVLISPPGSIILSAASNASSVVSDLVVIALSPPGRQPKLNATSLQGTTTTKKT